MDSFGFLSEKLNQIIWLECHAIGSRANKDPFLKPFMNNIRGKWITMGSFKVSNKKFKVHSRNSLKIYVYLEPCSIIQSGLDFCQDLKAMWSGSFEVDPAPARWI